jgi:hypothetical protein
MSDFTPVEGQKGLYRDNNTTAIINKDQSGYKSYIARKKSMEKKNLEMDKMKEDLNNVKGELGEIKNLLSTLVQKLNN